MSSGTGPIDLTRWPDMRDGAVNAKAAVPALPQPTEFEHLIELEVGLTVPASILPRADG
jgi:hypothetical protein